jgi:hypothetical protein
MSRPQPVPDDDELEEKADAARQEYFDERDREFVRLELSGDYAGQWVEMRTIPTIGEFKALMSGVNARVHVAAAQMVVAHSFGGSFDDQPLPVLHAVVAAWTKQAEDAALDPTPAVD